MALIHGFELLQQRDLHELNTRARLLRHVQTGAELLSLENDDENKVFGIVFRTPPGDSTGVAHIMEHSVLCGSQKYPLKEPFVELIKGSLKTFVNAFTFPDKTCYPLASQNLQDFYNLIDVYMDAVLHPLISRQTLQQEGWHYELDDPAEPLTFKGVVFNEMKGNYSSPENLLGRSIQHSLFPDNAYGVDSGGDPRRIPDLTYEGFKRFHQTFYHPSNARIFFYGDDDPNERLRRMQAYLAEFKALPVDSQVKLQPRFSQPRRTVKGYDAGDETDGKKNYVTVNWMLADSADDRRRLALQILAYILIGTPASPLRKALIDSGLGDDLTGLGFENELRQMVFSTGLKGVAAENVDRVEALILETLQELRRSGVEAEMIAAALNTIEFRLRENNTGSFPRGIALMLRSLTTWLHGGDPLAPLAFEKPLNAVKDELQRNPGFLQDLIEENLLANPHRTTLILQPDLQLRQREEQAEKARLEKVRQSLSPAALEQIVAETRQLKLRQETPDPPEALAKIPALTLADLDRENKRIPLETMDLHGSQVLYHDLFTNGILYLDLGFDLHSLPQEYLPYVTLLGRALLETGTARLDFVRLSQRIGGATGGIYPSTLTSARRDTDQATARLFLRGKSTLSQADELLDILMEVLHSARLDNRERFLQIVLEEKADQEAGLIPGGHGVVNSRLGALFGEAGWASEQMGGVSYLFFLRKLAQQIEQDWGGVQAVLEQMRALLVNRSQMVANVTLDAENWEHFRPRLADFLASLPAGPVLRTAWRSTPQAHDQGLSIPAQVNYVGKAADLYRLGYELHGSVMVVTHYLRTTWLWERVRVQGGAYGGYILFDHRSGVLSYLSYRDPNLLATLENYDRTPQFLRKLELSQEELTRAIIGVIGNLDAYQLPDAKGYTSMARYLAGENDAFRQQLRDQVLATTPAHFSAFGEVLERVRDSGSVVVMGSQDALAAVNAERSGWLEITKVL
jgi:Zn-dependent M16 (insulinase) family peptidase